MESQLLSHKGSAGGISIGGGSRASDDEHSIESNGSGLGYGGTNDRNGTGGGDHGGNGNLVGLRYVAQTSQIQFQINTNTNVNSHAWSRPSNITGFHAYTVRGPFMKKPLLLIKEQECFLDYPNDNDGPTSRNAPHRHLSLFDLLSVGVGGTVGSGIFVLTGAIASSYAGPATAISFAISGIAAGCSGLCYAEMAGRLPVAGSTYSYAYATLGEWAAVVSAACLTLEYGVSGAAVARSWGDKIVEWLTVEWEWEKASKYLLPGQNNNSGAESSLNPMAGVVSILCTFLLAYGIQESKLITNAMTTLKMAIVFLMIIGGFLLFQSKNLSPFVPFGAAGVLRGATSSFFGYLGYDEVCCLAAEAKHPRRDLPRAVLGTLACVTVLYIFASLALVGMLPTEEISATSGFPAAFKQRGWIVMAQVTAAGEVITLPVVVLISLLAQPRLQQALAQDGLIPEIFGRLERGNLKWGSVLAGVPMTILALFVPFRSLDDFISVGILVAFSLTNTSLIMLKCGISDNSNGGNGIPRGHPVVPKRHSPSGLLWYLGGFHISAFFAGLTCHLDSTIARNQFIQVLSFLCVVAMAFWIHANFPVTGSFDDDDPPQSNTSGLSCHPHEHHERRQISNGVYFQAPMVPLVPCLGILANWTLVAQLELAGIILLALYLGGVSILYLGYCRKLHPIPTWQAYFVGNAASDGTGHYDSLTVTDEVGIHTPDHLHDMVLLREFSLPKR